MAKSLALKEIQVKIPEIADFEVRRELLRADKFKGIERLNDLQKYLDYVPLTTQTMLKARNFGHKCANKECRQRMTKLWMVM